MAEVSALPAAYRQYDNQLETLKEELKTLRAHIEAASSLDWRPDPLSTHRAGFAGPTPDRR